MHILIVEDDRKTAALLSTTLKQEGFEVSCATNGEAGLKEALKGGCDALLVDIMLPKLDGLSLVRALRTQGHTTPVIMLSARGEVEQRVEGLDAGADDFLNKPLDREQLKVRLRVAERILGLHREIGDLRGALRVCPGCKSYCNDEEQWQPIETLLEPALNREIQPRCCPDCETRIALAAAD